MEIPAFNVSGNAVDRFVRAAKSKADAEAELAMARDEIVKEGLSRLFRHNISQPEQPSSSVKLVDDTDSRVLVTMQDRYTVKSVDSFEASCHMVGVDSGDYFHEVATAKFDDSIFVVQGDFDQAVYRAYYSAVEQATKDLITDGRIPRGSKVPLRTAIATVVRDDFHRRRWNDFTTTSLQARINEAIPAVVSVKPSGS